MSYTERKTISYNLGVIDYGAGTVARKIKGPSGMTGRIVDAHLDVSETFNSVTTSALLTAGTSTDADAFLNLDIGDAAVDTVMTATEQTGALIEANIPADTLVYVAGVAPTGGTPAGIANTMIVIDWFL
jgi:hypothetical protein